MKHVGHPLFGDASYGGTNILKGEGLPKFRAFVQNCFQVMPRQALHAQSLGFVHPASKKPVSFEADLPPDFSQVLRSEEHTSELQSLMRISYAVFCLNKKIK